MKKFLLLIFVFIIFQKLIGQQNYCDFEGNKVGYFGIPTGNLDSLHGNPAPSGINMSPYCAKYIRDTTDYDYIKFYPKMKLVDISQYALNTPQAPKLKMKLYSTAPVGTLVQIQLGLKSIDNYPAGTHSIYLTATTVQNVWENLTFDYLFSPVGSYATTDNIDKIALLFHPNSSDRDTIYFDDLMGPELIPASISQMDDLPAFKLYQNTPNPATVNTKINFQLNSPGLVSLKIVDLVGHTISTLIEENMKAGNYSIPIETSGIPDGLYFYVLKKDGVSRARKMIVLQ